MILALLNHLWQSTLFGAAVALLAMALRKSSASLRFWLWLAASLKFLIPFALLTAVGGQIAPIFDPGPELLALGEAAQRFPEFLPSGPVVNYDLTPVFDPAPWVLRLWSAGFSAITGVRLKKWRRLQAILRSSRPLQSVGSITVRVSTSVLEPGLFGVLRPVVVLPKGLSEVLAHEGAHLERRDNLWAALHMLVESVVWFHPMVWWIGRRLIDERERACDDAVVRLGHRREVYARAILKTCRAYLRSPLACVSGASGADLARRIETIMTAPAPGRLTGRAKGVLLAASALILLSPLLVGALGAPQGGLPWPSLLSGPTAVQIIHDLAEQKRSRKPQPFAPARFDAYTGDYAIGPYSILTVYRRGDRFFTQMTGQSPAELYWERGAEYFYNVVPAQISFLTGTHRRGRGLILHQGGVNEHLPRLDPTAAAERRTTLARRIAANRPSLGTDAYVRQWAVSIASGQPDYSQMGPLLEQAARAQWPGNRALFRTLGPFRDLQFLRVSPQGADLYEADFQNRKLFVRVEPIVRGKITSHFWRLL